VLLLVLEKSLSVVPEEFFPTVTVTPLKLHVPSWLMCLQVFLVIKFNVNINDTLTHKKD